VQSDYLDDLNVRAVVPLLPLDIAPIPARRLNPVLQVGNMQVSMVTQYVSSVPSSVLREAVTDFSSHRDEVTAALDMLLHGF